MQEVLLVGGPYDGETPLVNEPLPRYGYIQYGGENYLLSDVTAPPWTADHVSAADEDATDLEGVTEGPAGPPGAIGPEGPPGETGEQGEPGMALHYEGDWDADVSYTELAVVQYDNAIWISNVILNLANTPGTDPQWDLMVTGATGPAVPVQDEGTDLTTRARLNFVGAGVTATDDAANDRTLVTVSGGGSPVYEQLTEPVTTTVGAIWIVQEPA